jgi:hypothetical protein
MPRPRRSSGTSQRPPTLAGAIRMTTWFVGSENVSATAARRGAGPQSPYVASPTRASPGRRGEPATGSVEALTTTQREFIAAASTLVATISPPAASRYAARIGPSRMHDVAVRFPMMKTRVIQPPAPWPPSNRPTRSLDAQLRTPDGREAGAAVGNGVGSATSAIHGTGIAVGEAEAGPGAARPHATAMISARNNPIRMAPLSRDRLRFAADSVGPSHTSQVRVRASGTPVAKGMPVCAFGARVAYRRGVPQGGRDG